MGLLAPLFLAAAGAISLPIVLHLIRRSPRGRVLFSSLMFLSPSPPRVTKRSRLEHWPLLLLRALAVILLAMAFARPFLWSSATAELDDAGPGKRLVILLDISASMQRDELWWQAVSEATDLIEDAGPTDLIALYAFDRQTKPLLRFDQWSQTPVEERATLAREALESVEPGFSGTHLGDALVTAADVLEQQSASEKADDVSGPRRITIISDMQRGADVKSLQAFEWPADILVKTVEVRAKSEANAGVQIAAPLKRRSGTNASALRLRVFNAPGSKKDRFTLRFEGAQPGEQARELEAYAPAGEARIITAPAELADWRGRRVELVGDDAAFDNVAWRITPKARPISIVYLGDDLPTDADAPLYFLERAYPSSERRKVELLTQKPDDPITPDIASHVDLLFVAQSLPEAHAETLRQAASNGLTVVVVLRDAGMADTLATLLDQDDITATEASVRDYAMWTDVDITHPLFAPFADPRFGDFTKIRFWKYRAVALGEIENASVLATFDGKHPAIVDAPVGDGRIVVFASGWHPADGQLARSSKFAPLLNVLLREAMGGVDRSPRYVTGEPIDLSWLGRRGGEESLRVTKPDGGEVELSDESYVFAEADQPGVYQVEAGPRSASFAVNVPAAESDTSPLDPGELEALGVRLDGALARSAEQLELAERQMRMTELEDRQRMWRWLIVAALGVLVFETWLAGHLAGKGEAEAQNQE